MKALLLLVFITSFQAGLTQELPVTLSEYFSKMEEDPQFSSAIIGFYVLDSKSGKIIYSKNENTGLAPASTLKIITSATAFEMLGKDYRFKTTIGYSGKITKHILDGNLIITGYGDPSFGSDRWQQTSHPEKEIAALLQARGIKKITGGIFVNDLKWGYDPIPDGWIWQDIGNYYGAGARGFNWHENQFDLFLQSADTAGGPTTLIKTAPPCIARNIINAIGTGEKNSGDNAYLYSTPYNNKIFAKGTIPPAKNNFNVKGSLPDAALTFAEVLGNYLTDAGISHPALYRSYGYLYLQNEPFPQQADTLQTLYSPILDSINYWFLQKSVNLFGEAFLKMMAIEKNKPGLTDSGVHIIRNFWAAQQIEKNTLKIVDGSGLSPANRVTAKALVNILSYARKQSWFPRFYDALPVIHGIKMKSGYISGTRAYTGFIENKKGENFTFAIIVNNIDGSPTSSREKIWQLLDLLK